MIVDTGPNQANRKRHSCITTIIGTYTFYAADRFTRCLIEHL